MNNTERTLWLYNDESLYNWWCSTGLSASAFIKQYRKEIDAVINNAVKKESVK